MVHDVRYFAAAIRGDASTITEIDKDTIAYHFHEPLGVVGQIIPGGDVSPGAPRGRVVGPRGVGTTSLSKLKRRG